MRPCNIAIMALLLAACGSQAESQADPPGENRLSAEAGRFEIPSRFRGNYSNQISDCGSFQDDSRLKVMADRLRFHESEDVLRQIYFLEDGSIVILADSSGEGETWTSSYRLSIDDAGQVLSIQHPRSADTEGTSDRRLRCPGG